MKNKIIIVFFYLLLVLPTVSYPFLKNVIDSENHENRSYAKLPKFSIANIQNITTQLEDFYIDRIPYKNQMKRLQSYLDDIANLGSSKYEVYENTKNVTVGEDDWMFYTIRDEGEDSVADFFGTNLYSQAELSNLAASYQKVTDYFRSNNQEFVLFMIPSKEHVYPKYMPDIYKESNRENRVDIAIDYLKEHTSTDIVYPRDIFEANKEKYQLYYKYDSHWNNIGALLGVEELNHLVQGQRTDLKNIKFDKKDRKDGDLACLLGRANDYVDDEYVSKNYKSSVNVQLVEANETRSFYRFKSDAKDTRKILFLGDSFRVAVVNCLPQSYGETIITNDLCMAKDVLNNEKPDVIVFEVAERYSSKFENTPQELIK